MTKDTSLQLIIEGALMASEGPISLQDIANLFDENKPSKNEIKQVIENLNKSYKNNSFYGVINKTDILWYLKKKENNA